jgi:hypothetical protein
MKAHKFLGSLKDALLAAGRDETPMTPPALPPAAMTANREERKQTAAQEKPSSPSAEEAARLARTEPSIKLPDAAPAVVIELDAPPTTRVVRPEPMKAPKPEPEESPRTVLVRGRQKIEHSSFERDPAVGFLIVVGGPGLGAFRPIFEGNNTVGRSATNRIPLDFGDDAISNEARGAGLSSLRFQRSIFPLCAKPC